MRRTALTFAIIAALGTAALIVLTSRDGASGYRVSAVFDSARGIEGGMTVKIAGARVGKVRSVHLTPSRKARIDFEVPARFGPFHADARCRILPEGAISENYVACSPGTPGRPILPAPDGRPTVPLSHTTVPVTLQDVIEIFGA